MKERRKARAIALQTLFEADAVRHDPHKVLEAHLEETLLSEECRTLSRELVQGVHARSKELDELIQRLAPEWPVGQMALIDRGILRMAIFEVGFRSQTPMKVAINEAVELAKLFGSESSRRFVNGVLATLVSEIEEGLRLDHALEAKETS